MKGRATPGSAAAEAKPVPTASVQAAPAEARPADILIVDDTASNLQILSDMLKEEGYRTRAAVSGAAALRAAASQAPDLILLDIMMPEMDGYEVCRRLKAEARLKDVPVIFLSALSETEDKVRAFAAGGADYVTKPFQFDEVRARVAAHLRLRQQQLEIERSSEAKYRRLFETAKDGILLLDAEAGEITDVNPFLMDMLGRSHDELLGKHLWDIGLFEDVAAAQVALRTLREEGHVRCANLPLETRDGRRARVEFVSSAYAVDGREVIQCSIRDITERVRAEEALREQEERIRQAYVDVIDAVTGGKLILLTEEALASELGSPVGELVPIASPAALGQARRSLLDAIALRFGGWIPGADLLNPVCEAWNNALKHAGGGTCRVFATETRLQVAVTDGGPGIDFRTLPKATLVPGFSTAASLGMGFTIMLQLCERVLLCTRPGLTEVVLEVPLSADFATIA